MDEKKKIPHIGGEKAGYMFEFRSDGVYMTVYPNATSGMMFELSDMRQILKEYGIDDYDVTQIARLTREASETPTKIATHYVLPPTMDLNSDDESDGESTEERKKYGSVIVEVSKDRLEAKVRFIIEEGQEIPTVEMVHEALELRNVTYGLDFQAIEKGCKSGMLFIAARGIAPINGLDATIEKKFDQSKRGRPVANEYNQVDFKNLNLCTIARKGQLLAERIPQTKGTSGTNIYGDKVPAKNGRPKPIPMGKNTEILGENSLIASIDGQIIDNGIKISIDPRLDIRGDVGVATGNIDFIGGVVIGGDVSLGFKVKASGDVEVKGNICGAEVVGRNVYVHGGIQGQNRGKIISEGDVRATFIENANIEAGGSIYVHDVVMHSTLRASKEVAVEGGKGQITGGNLAAGDEISAYIIGNPANVITKVSVGVNPILKQKYQDTLKEYLDSKKRLEQLSKTLNTLGKIDISLLPPDKVEQINALVRSQFPLAGAVERGEKELQELDVEIKKMQKGKIKVRDVIYPGVKMNINSIYKNVMLEERHCTQYVEDEFIKVGPY